MRSLQDAVYNWLSIKVVADHRPEDQSAVETTRLFREILSEDHKVESIDVQCQENRYVVTCEILDQKPRTFHFPRELIETIYHQIKNEPDKYPTFAEDQTVTEDE